MSHMYVCVSLDVPLIRTSRCTGLAANVARKISTKGNTGRYSKIDATQKREIDLTQVMGKAGKTDGKHINTHLYTIDMFVAENAAAIQCI